MAMMMSVNEFDKHTDNDNGNLVDEEYVDANDNEVSQGAITD